MPCDRFRNQNLPTSSVRVANVCEGKRQNMIHELEVVVQLFRKVKHWGLKKSINSTSLNISFFFNDTATTEIYTLSLHDALPIWREFGLGAAVVDVVAQQ